MSQSQHSSANRQAWSHRAYEAWKNGYGTPGEAAAGIRNDPESILREYRQYLGDVEGKRVANLLGSHGRRAVALAVLGAEVSVVDISDENRRYALEVAQCAGVSIDYVVSDLTEWDHSAYADAFDLVLMEYGILHYFVDLNALADTVRSILKSEGRVVLHEFHPVVKKCDPVIEDGHLTLRGDYFSTDVREAPAPFRVDLPDADVDALPNCRYRWTIGEVVTAVGTHGLAVEHLVEKPHSEYSALPGTFSLVARKL